MPRVTPIAQQEGQINRSDAINLEEKTTCGEIGAKIDRRLKLSD
jgi:hypothetical protein